MVRVYKSWLLEFNDYDFSLYFHMHVHANCSYLLIVVLLFTQMYTIFDVHIVLYMAWGNGDMMPH